MMRRPWGSGTTTPTGEGDNTPISPGPGADVPGGWPVPVVPDVPIVPVVPVVPIEEPSRRTSRIEGDEEVERPAPVGRNARGRRAGRKGKGS
jgi:hypothetical protein